MMRLLTLQLRLPVIDPELVVRYHQLWQESMMRLSNVYQLRLQEKLPHRELVFLWPRRYRELRLFRLQTNQKLNANVF